MVYILTRSNKRPIFFQQNHLSIYKQTYKHWRHIVSYHNDETLNYLKNYTDIITIEVPPYERSNQNHFPYNLYCNFMHQQVQELINNDDANTVSLIMYLDDDDVFTTDDALNIIINHLNGSQYRSEKRLLCWRTKFPNEIVPSNRFFGKNIGLRTPSISFAFTNDLLPMAIWDQYKGGDSRLARLLGQKCQSIIWIDHVLTKVNYDDKIGGNGQSQDKHMNE